MAKTISMKAPFISEDRKRELSFFQSKTGLSFSDISVLDNAFIHSSYANEARSRDVSDNERLEFLGDSILSIVTSEWLYNNIQGDEGECTRIRSLVVSEDALYEVATNLELDKYLKIGHGEELTGGRKKKAILADCTEALFAAVYLDMGFEKAKSFILSQIVPIIQKVVSTNYKRDYKTELQEYVQKRYKKVPKYEMVASEGPEHDQTFSYTVSFQSKTYGPAKGHNKKDAEQNVAKLALESLKLI
ncbi:MAG: ribonuclease III [Spirochaetales bacterium]|nr:ribonuclease III [Spirochaetales bacterium]